MKLEAKIHGTTYPVVIEKKRNKNTYIRVNKDYEIYVTTSLFAPTKAILKLVKANEEAIFHMIEKKRKEEEREKKKFQLFGLSYRREMKTIEQLLSNGQLSFEEIQKDKKVLDKNSKL